VSTLIFRYIGGSYADYISDNEGATDNSSAIAGSGKGDTGMESHHSLDYNTLYFRGEYLDALRPEGLAYRCESQRGSGPVIFFRFPGTEVTGFVDYSLLLRLVNHDFPDHISLLNMGSLLD
jgi:hypothetical protein